MDNDDLQIIEKKANNYIKDLDVDWWVTEYIKAAFYDGAKWALENQPGPETMGFGVK